MSRAKVEKFWLEAIRELEDGDVNVDIHKELLKGLSNKEFEQLMQNFRDKVEYPSMVVPNGAEFTLNTARSRKVGERLGVNFFQRIVYTDPATGETIVTPEKYIVSHQTARRQKEHLIKKQSIPEGDSVIDAATGQVTGADKGSRMSLPELQALEGKRMHAGLAETTHIRGGDGKALQAMRKSIQQTGRFSLAPIQAAGTKTTSTQTMRATLIAMLLDTEIGK